MSSMQEVKSRPEPSVEEGQGAGDALARAALLAASRDGKVSPDDGKVNAVELQPDSSSTPPISPSSPAQSPVRRLVLDDVASPEKDDQLTRKDDPKQRLERGLF